MRGLYLIPGAVSRRKGGAAELARRGAVVQRLAKEGWTMDTWEVAAGPASIESAYEEYLAVPGAIERLVEAERAGFDGAILGCFGDPGLEAAREMVSIPVTGPGEASMLFAATLGHRFSIVTVLDTVCALLERLAWQVGVDRKLASVRAIDVPVLDLDHDPEETFARMVREAEAARDRDRADVIVMGCMTMAFQDRQTEMARLLGIPVVNPLYAAVKMMQALAELGLRHSRRAYPTPPKLRRQAAATGPGGVTPRGAR
ncbi:MAG: aspartate/glutamate racemase family protein [Armatimonadota bacterium]|nr:aspartate/glutamate racemase family protein [Armatimonadota bacterium]MDR7519297.1 aspartate/glutamate racemase family protein [Armatimonadota bacterium]MDR7549286.1 aspartate/glutamate racemase family protein [Armatimonadota bacterium]